MIYIMSNTEVDSTMLTDEEILVSYKDDEQELLKILINRYTRPLYNFVARLANRNDAPDIIQEVFIKTWKNIYRFDREKASFKTWIFTIAKNTTTDFLRKKRNLLFSDMARDEDGDLNSFAENIPTDDLLPDIALQKLQDSE